MRKAIAYGIVGATLIASNVYGVHSADAAPRTRTITVARECQYEDGSGPRDTRKNSGCVFYGEGANGVVAVVNFDGGRRYAVVKSDRRGNVPTVNKRMPLRLTYVVKSGKVQTVRHASGRWSVIGGRIVR